MTRKPRVFSGIQPSGNLHIGNYLGAIQQWVAGQGQKTNFICIVDLHAITVPQNPADLRRQTRELAALLLACGIDPQQTTLFVQSHVRAHAECSWVFSCITPLGWLERMTQYKAKAQKQESVMTGLLTYPVLMAADILLYDADEVPVGEDQKQHIELTRDLAQRFNYLFGETFVIPKPVIRESGARIMGLDDPTVKMSKSETTRGHAIRIIDDPDEIRWAIKRAVTDSFNEIRFSDDPERAGVNNLLQIYELLTGRSRPEIEAHFAGKGYGALKRELAEVVIEALRPIRERYYQLMDDPAELDRILAIGAEQARAVAEPKMTLILERVGFVLPKDRR
ncbi:tryptophan--tRNA ligase [Chloroflexus sp. MS-CIW-1]|jgi:tryptophanyl-tRNA synthetase|uniref:tryptophan--tRNA ligase n=1 Tax=Chloroflexus sp. MS-CIW-1 TaxID=3055768 RepID=UPI0026494B03|nr:tryptophan--tRNA ligase [Chloroflexus sp. MS-CIW-1]MDN5271349.1 tryptophan--tRNA ligase [Chloroflexus sp. MS-CIW-1]